MNLAEMIAAVALVTQFLKKILPRVNITGTIAVIVTAVATIGVVAYDYTSQSKPFDFFAFAITAIQVFIGSNAAYNLIKVARPK
jgi:uncharacterized membrane protein YjdF